ncbi:MAG: protein-L-isoaspartate O-methyltransferase [Flavobacteriaceae bacterium]|nr:protein-L-isoaspartate O-methyltransferase [Flavobacteriaceae bacterium]|tara:strand:+ start:1686 stop:2333 length:648 start_codon:yes stop_codon:yes gene_type:complete
MTPNIDSPKYQGQRKLMASKLKSLGINNKNVLNALNSVPRHLFMDSGLISHSYKNMAYPIDSGQTISQPYTVAFQTELINCKEGDEVLEIGTGSGYQTAILSYLGFNVFTIERDVTLFKKSSLIFKNLSIKIKKNLLGDGYLGIVDSAPFDAIIVTAAAKEIPKNLMNQLKVGGRMVIPIGEDEQIMYRFTRIEKSTFKREEFGQFKFVPMVKGK